MGTKALVSPDIEKGELVVKALDDEGVRVRSAFWLYVPEASEWRLILAMPLVDHQGSRAGYEIVQKVLAKRDLASDVPLRQITVVGPGEPLPKLLRSVLKTPPNAVGGTRFTNTVIGDVLIEDAYVYRSA